MLSITFDPMVAWPLIAGLGALAAALIAFGLYRAAGGVWWRTLAVSALVLALANPVLIDEQRVPITDFVTVVVDGSPSQMIDGRETRTTRALADLRTRIEALPGLELNVVRAGSGAGGILTGDGTRLFEALNRSLANVPRKRMAATILLTDGQVHDVPAADAALPFAGPLHVVLTGQRRERDRRLVIEDAPSFGLVGKSVGIRVRVDDPAATGRPARLRIKRGDGTEAVVDITIGQARTIPMALTHAGVNVEQIEVDAVEGELTTVNNRAVVQVNGVRERLRVLLVSGEPHPGERVWRNLLKADPSVDLVHFTILRPPEKQDATPVRELSLIAFPIRELFEVKLDEFDLIIFDRYRRRGVLPSIYLENIVRYVENGGAVLEAAGPAFASALSLSQTPLGAILPGTPTGRVFERGLKARLTGPGARHPVTADLPNAGDEPPSWGRWFRQIEVTATRGTTLLKGVGGRPLLIVDRVKKGRVAQLLSDHIWLWARGFEGGGPQSELLRRLAHWLMKEPDLEENTLRAVAGKDGLTIMRRSLEPDPSPVVVTSPSGATRNVTLKPGVGGRAAATIAANEIGVYGISDGTRTTLAAVGNTNPLEFADMRATAERLAPLAAATGGGVFWAEDGPVELRRVRAGRATAGRGWAGLVANRNFRVASVREIPLLPGLVMLLLALGALMAAWRREGR
jgi:hypothetical protein